jgi:chromosome partitioning protein
LAARVVSFINLKGGVGKTTLALAVGEFLAFWGLGQKVLLIDIDGQSNLSYALLPQGTLKEIWQQEKSIYHMFKAALDGKVWDIEQAIIKDCSNIRGNTNLHAIVCSPDLGQLDEDILVRLEKGAKIQGDFRIVLGEQLRKIKDRYNWIIIDCPPSLSTITSNAILCSDYWIAPIVPEALSLLGIELIQTRIEGLTNRYGKKGLGIKFAGSILNRIDIRRKDHIKAAEGVYYESNFYHPFEHWVGDWKPLYIVSDYNYPFEAEDRVARGWAREWLNVEEKYGANEKRRNPPSPLLNRKLGFDSSFYIREVIRFLANEFTRRCP